MALLDVHFEDFLDRQINLSAAQVSQGSKSHTYIRELLANKNGRDSSFPRLLEGDFLSGSYARGTKLFPLDDIDVMIILDGAKLYPLREGVAWEADVRHSSEEENPLLDMIGEDGLLSSRTVLDAFRAALVQSHPNSTVSKDGQAINVWLEGYEMGIDVVPSLHVIPRDGSQDVYYIPMGGDSGSWIMTNPKVDEHISNSLHDRHNKKLKGVLKLIKFWNRNHNGDLLRSYHLETVAWYVFHNHPAAISSYSEGLSYFFEHAGPFLAQSCNDATGIGRPVDTYLTPSAREASLIQLRQANRTLKEALFLGLANETRQFAGWRKVLSDQFGR